MTVSPRVSFLRRQHGLGAERHPQECCNRPERLREAAGVAADLVREPHPAVRLTGAEVRLDEPVDDLLQRALP